MPLSLATAKQDPVSNINDRSCQQRVSGLDGTDYVFYAYNYVGAVMTDAQLNTWMEAVVNGAFTAPQ